MPRLLRLLLVNLGPGELVLLMALLGAVTGIVGYSWRPTVRYFVQFFLLGALLPVAGLLVALAIKKYAPARSRAV